MAAASPAPFLSSAAPPDLLQAALEISLTGFVLLRPLYRAADPLTVTDLAYEHLNPAAQRMLRLPERPAESFLTLYPHAVDTGVFAFYRDTFLAGEAGRFDVNYQHDGLDNYFQLTARRAGDLLVVSFSDTAEQPRPAVETALRASQAAEKAALAAAEHQRGQLQRLFAQVPVAMALFRGPEYVIELANEPMATIWGRPLAQVLGQPVFDTLPYVRGQGFEAIFADVLAQGTPYDLHEVPVTIDRAHLGHPEQGYFNLTYRPQRDVQGRITGIITSAYEITEQVRARQQVEQFNRELELRIQVRTREAENARAEAEAQRTSLERLFMQAPAAICILAGPELVFELVNPRHQRMFPGRELLGRPLCEAMPDLYAHEGGHTLRHVYETGVENEEAEILVPMSRVEGDPVEDIYFHSVQQPRYSAHGQIDGVLVFTYDITEQVRARQQVQGLNQELAAINEELTATNEELNASNTQLVRTNVDLDNFIYTASHDLKAPITNIEGLLYLLREELPADVIQAGNVAPTLTHLLDAVERFKRTIDHLTEVSKLQKEHTPVHTAVDLAAVVEDVRQDLAPLLRATNAQLTVAVADFPAILFSEKNLRSVVYNLLSNALKYRHPDRRPHVDVQGHFTVLEVHDNGLGLEPQHLAKLFTLFQRFHTHVEGTGIGLFMIKRMVENAGGRLEVHSQLGAGSTFFVHLPHAPIPSAT